jgi:hypothetical protein
LFNVQLEGSGAGSISRLQHLRLVALLQSLLCMDTACIAVFAYMLSLYGPSVLILFAFEYFLMALEVVRVAYRYVIVLIAARIPGEWHDRSLYLLYGKLLVDVVKLAVYVSYFVLLFFHYGMPIIMVRDLVRNFMEVNGELHNVMAARRLRHQIISLPEPSPEDIATRDATCSVCFGDITVEEAASARILPCLHMLHTSCMLQLVRRQQVCPMCRADLGEMLGRATQAQRARAAIAIAQRAEGAAPVAAAVPQPPAVDAGLQQAARTEVIPRSSAAAVTPAAASTEQAGDAGEASAVGGATAAGGLDSSALHLSELRRRRRDASKTEHGLGRPSRHRRHNRRRGTSRGSASSATSSDAGRADEAEADEGGRGLTRRSRRGDRRSPAPQQGLLGRRGGVTGGGGGDAGLYEAHATAAGGVPSSLFIHVPPTPAAAGAPGDGGRPLLAGDATAIAAGLPAGLSAVGQLLPMNGSAAGPLAGYPLPFSPHLAAAMLPWTGAAGAIAGNDVVAAARSARPGAGITAGLQMPFSPYHPYGVAGMPLAGLQYGLQAHGLSGAPVGMLPPGYYGAYYPAAAAGMYPGYAGLPYMPYPQPPFAAPEAATPPAYPFAPHLPPPTPSTAEAAAAMASPGVATAAGSAGDSRGSEQAEVQQRLVALQAQLVHLQAVQAQLLQGPGSVPAAAGALRPPSDQAQVAAAPASPAASEGAADVAAATSERAAVVGAPAAP